MLMGGDLDWTLSPREFDLEGNIGWKNGQKMA
jgi:hypothetical protein